MLDVCLLSLQATNIKNELEKLLGGQFNSTQRLEKLTSDHSKLQEMSGHQRKQLEESMEKNRSLQQDIKKLQSQLDRQLSGHTGGSLRHISGRLMTCSSRIKYCLPVIVFVDGVMLISGGGGEMDVFKQRLAEAESQKNKTVEEKELLEQQMLSLVC